MSASLESIVCASVLAGPVHLYHDPRMWALRESTVNTQHPNDLASFPSISLIFINHCRLKLSLTVTDAGSRIRLLTGPPAKGSSLFAANSGPGDDGLGAHRTTCTPVTRPILTHN